MERINIGPRVGTGDGLMGAYAGARANCFEVYETPSNRTLGIFDTVEEARSFARAIAAFEGASLFDFTEHYK